MPNEIAKGDAPEPQAVAEKAPSPTPTGTNAFAIVGIGASAGGHAAFSDFFDLNRASAAGWARLCDCHYRTQH
jgi:chemotaxis response regulator CheB